MRVLYISEVQWLSQASRKHHMVRRFPRDWEVVFLSPINAKRGENSFRLKADTRHANVRFLSLALPKPDSTLAVARILSEAFSSVGMHGLRSTMDSFEPDVIVTSYIWAFPVLPHARSRRIPVVYDCNDLHPDFYPARAAEAEEAFRTLVRSADEVVASSARLKEICGRGVVIGNGVDLDLFGGRVNRPLPRAVAESPIGSCKKFVAYVGSVNRRVDFRILETLAATAVDAGNVGIVCIGRIYDAVRSEVEALAERYRDHILFTGLVPYDELPTYLSHASVGIAPFVLNERTQAINPNKLYMYAAMEQNIVSTPFSADIKEHGDLIFTADDPDSFARAVKEALGDEERRRAVRDRIAVPNSWDEKAKVFCELLSQVASGGRGEA